MPSEQFAPLPSKDGIWDVVIIGSGPAALTSAIYTTRGAASTMIIAGDSWGGQLMLTTLVDNFPGFPEGVQGPELMSLMRTQAERFGAQIVEKRVASVDFSKAPFLLNVEGEEIKARSVIVATGAEAKWLGVPGEDRLRGRGVSSCAPCDAPFFKDKEVIVVGGGDAAMEEALVISKYAQKVTLVHRRDSFRASAVMQKRIFDHNQIEVLWNSEVAEILGDQKVEGVKLLTKDKGEWEMKTDGVFVAIGHIPSTAEVKTQLTTDELGYLERAPRGGYEMTTSIEGVFTAGDVHDMHYRQAITASGFGAMAGLDVLRFLDKDIQTW